MMALRLKLAWKEAAKASGVDLKPSVLRHFMATYLITQGLSREEVDLIQGRSLKNVVAWTHYIEIKNYVESSFFFNSDLGARSIGINVSS